MTEESPLQTGPASSTNVGSKLNYSASSAILRALAADDPAGLGENAPSINVDGYVVVKILGQGAGGQTYLAERVHTRAPVALKILKPRTSDERSIRRAWRELEILQQLRLPNVPRLLDFGPHEHSLFIATEYIEGSSLDRVFAQAPPETRAQLREPVQLLANIARAVQQLHERGVIHRDLKPSNIMITADRSPFIIDFGISALQTADHNLTLTAEGDPIGTPSYMPPEQARGERNSMSIRSDVYSLGAIGYWLLTGRTPHDLNGMTLHSAIHKVGWEPPRSPREIKPDMPPKLAAVLAKACNADPSRRYASAIDFAVDLAAWLDGKPVSASPPTLWQRATGWAGHHPVLTSTAASLAIAGGIIGTAGATYWELVGHPTGLSGDSAGTFVELVSRAGKRFHRWESPSPHGVVFYKFVPARASTESSDVAVIAMSFEGDANPLERLRVFAASDPERVLWQTPTHPPGIQRPEGARGWDWDDLPENYRVSSACIHDFYPARPGQEILITFNHSSKSPACIRIYSLDGEQILYEAWHNGQIKTSTYMPENRLIVFHAVTDEPRLSDLGVDAGSHEHPVMLVALNLPKDPDAEGRTPRLLDSWAQTPPDAIAWSRMILPIELYDFCDRVRFSQKVRAELQIDLHGLSENSEPPDLLHISVGADGEPKNVWPDGRSREKYASLSKRIELIRPDEVNAWLENHPQPVIGTDPATGGESQP